MPKAGGFTGSHMEEELVPGGPRLIAAYADAGNRKSAAKFGLGGGAVVFPCGDCTRRIGARATPTSDRKIGDAQVYAGPINKITNEIIGKTERELGATVPRP